MPRTYHKKGVHTSPEKAGAKNLEGVNLPKDEAGIMDKIMPIYKHGGQVRGIYKGQWTDEALADEITKFFDYCQEANFKPTQPALRLWLATNKETLHEWRYKPEKYGVKSALIKEAFDIMELYLQANIDSYPTGSIFLLKSSFGHKETTQVDITQRQTSVSTEDIDQIVSDLGLDKAN